MGDINGITVVDDYGHHPTEVKATLAAASSLGYKHVDVVFQPHRYSRLQALCDDFADAFANADKLLLIDVFSAGEMPIPGVTSKMLADTVRAKHPGKEVVYCSSRLELNEELEKMVGEGDLLLTMRRRRHDGRSRVHRVSDCQEGRLNPMGLFNAVMALSGMIDTDVIEDERLARIRVIVSAARRTSL